MNRCVRCHRLVRVVHPSKNYCFSCYVKYYRATVVNKNKRGMKNV